MGESQSHVLFSTKAEPYQDSVTWTKIDQAERQLIRVEDFWPITPPRDGLSEGRHALQTIDARQPLAVSQ